MVLLCFLRRFCPFVFHLHKGGCCFWRRCQEAGDVLLCVFVAFIICEAGWPLMFSSVFHSDYASEVNTLRLLQQSAAEGEWPFYRFKCCTRCLLHLHCVGQRHFVFNGWIPVMMAKKAPPPPCFMCFVAIGWPEPWRWRVAPFSEAAAGHSSLCELLFFLNTEWLLTNGSETRDV